MIYPWLNLPWLTQPHSITLAKIPNQNHTFIHVNQCAVSTMLTCCWHATCSWSGRLNRALFNLPKQDPHSESYIYSCLSCCQHTADTQHVHGQGGWMRPHSTSLAIQDHTFIHVNQCAVSMLQTCSMFMARESVAPQNEPWSNVNFMMGVMVGWDRSHWGEHFNINVQNWT